MLTLEKLEDMNPQTVFANGTIAVEDYWDADRDMIIDFVAIRGEIPDWTVYYALSGTRSMESILAWGDKMRNMNSIQRCVPCDKDALEMYRF